METDPTHRPPPVGVESIREDRPDLTPAGALPLAQCSAPAHVVIVVLAAIAFLYVARPVVLPVVLACMGGMTLKPLVRWFSDFHIPREISSAVLLLLLVAAIGFGFFHLGRPALVWMNEAPQHMTELRQRVQKMVPPLARFSLAAEAVNNLGATEAEQNAQQKKSPTVEVTVAPGAGSILHWTGDALVFVGETLVLMYFLLASGDLFQHKLLHVMPTLRGKKRAMEINQLIQQNISNYLFTVTLVNLCLGIVVSLGFYFMGVPNPAMWGTVVALLNFVPYFGPVLGVLLLAVVGLLTFDTLWQGLLPSGLFLLLHLVEANLITPLLLGRRFTLNPVVIFVSLIFWTWLWGVPGALLSLPILVTIKIICDHVPRLSPVSELLSS